MVNQEQVKMLKAGIAVWNGWKVRHPEVWSDLHGAILRYTDLSGADLSGADLSGADLSGAELGGANLHGVNLIDANLYDAYLVGAYLHEADLGRVNLYEANLSDANLSDANLRGANLRGANLRGANLRGANLSEANLTGTDLTRVNLVGTNLTGANFQGTGLGYTLFAHVDLCTVTALDTAVHYGPSTIDVNTVQLPGGETRINFLRGAGFSDTFIDYLPSLLTAAIQYGSCFIGYTHQDEALARRLYRDLQARGVRCWFAPYDLRPGDYYYSRIDEAIHFHENTVLLLSAYALQSSWVEHEVQMVLAREIAQNCTILFPLRLDEAVMLASDGWVVRLRGSRHMGDFTQWRDDAIYQRRFAELLRYLKV